MTQVKFIYDKEKDLFNIWETSTAKNYGYDFSSKLPKEVVEFCKNKKYENSKKFIEAFFSNIYNSGFIQIQEKALNNAWSKIEEEYFKRLKKITGKPLGLKSSKGFITIAPRCPYLLDEGNFMVNFFASIPSALLTAGHELMHLHFHEHYFNEIEIILGNSKTHKLKEALTVILNPEFMDLWFIPDNGYDAHKGLRKFILNEWKKERNFDSLLKKAVEFMKREKS